MNTPARLIASFLSAMVVLQACGGGNHLAVETKGNRDGSSIVWEAVGLDD